jgi:DNA-binding response OmpR family regulator
MSQTRRRILCLEDDKDSCALLAILLGSEDYDVVTVETIAEASRLIKSESFDLLIVDVILTEGNGLEFCREVRGDGYQIPILVHSGAAEEADIVAAMEAGANDYLIKPYGWTSLLEKVCELFSEAKGGSQ